MDTIIVVGWGFTIAGWLFTLYRDDRNRKQDRDIREQERKEVARREKIRVVLDFANALAEIQELYRFFARKEEHIVTDEEGVLLRDESGAPVIEESSLEPEERFKQALEGLEEADIRGAIAQSVVRARITQGEAFAIAEQLDPSGELKNLLGLLQWKTTSLLESSLEKKDFDSFCSSLQRAGESYSTVRLVLDGLL